MTDPVISDAIKLRDEMLEVARELRFTTPRSANHRTLLEMDAERCDAAAAMLEKLGTEVTRLRLGIGHLFYGRMDRIELNQMTKGWNSDQV